MKPVVGIFAHPDDEAFGPAGTLALWAKERDVYLICVTDGSAGKNGSGKTEPLAQIRRDELSKSAKVLGVKEVFFLDYKDGALSNNLYHEIAEKTEDILKRIKPEILVTFEQRGITGHLDHIAVSMVASYVFDRSPDVTELWQYCFTEKQRASFGDYYIYCPPGYTKEEISKEVDVSNVWDIKIAAMRKHKSQTYDMEKALSHMQNLPKVECFLCERKRAVNRL